MMILEPPAEPMTKRTSPVVVFSAIRGEMEESGRLPGTMKLIVVRERKGNRKVKVRRERNRVKTCRRIELLRTLLMLEHNQKHYSRLES